MNPKLAARVANLFREKEEVEALARGGMNEKLEARIFRLLGEQREIMALLREALEQEECLAAALEMRLGRPPVTGDSITEEDARLSFALRRLLESGVL